MDHLKYSYKNKPDHCDKETQNTTKKVIDQITPNEHTNLTIHNQIQNTLHIHIHKEANEFTNKTQSKQNSDKHKESLLKKRTNRTGDYK